MNNDWLDIAVLEDYLDGKLDAQAMHRVEREALEDPFVAEALEGLKAMPKRKQTLSILQKQLHDRVKNQPVKRKMWGITTHRLSIAATATVAFIAVSILFIMRENNRRNQLAKQDHKEVMINLDSSRSAAKQEVLTKATAAKKAKSLAKAAVVSAAPVISKSSSRKADGKEPINNPIKSNVDVVSALSKGARIASAAPQKTNQIGSVARSTANGVGISEKINEVLTGKVVAKDDGLALPGVTVRLEGSNVSTTTDKNGNFSLVADSTKKNNLVASYIGYKSKVIVRNLGTINSLQGKPIDSAKINKSTLANGNLVANNSLKITLEPDNQSLNEVVVVGYGAPAKKQVLASATTIMSTRSLPNSGWTKWREYLQKNNRFVKNDVERKEVVLGFHVSNQGAPIYIKVIKGIGKKENQEAIRLLTEGPLWKTVDDEVQVTIDF